jgi:uncharacterized protein (DUF1800 family)
MSFVLHKNKLIDFLLEEVENPVDEETFLLNKITFGATSEEIEKVKKMGWNAFVDEQLNPVDEKDDLVHQKLSSLMLPIKYAESKDKYPAVDEARPLGYLEAALDKLWPLTDYKTPMANQERVRPVEEVRMASWIRAVYSQWQLKELLVEFWHNHFNVNALGETKISATFPIYDRDVIRKNCLGNFRVFLEDVAKSTAMQYYLDNATSKASPANENYARELFELHTLGSDFYYNNLYNRWREVPGALQGKPIGYIDEDVYEAARSFTGWTIADGAGLGRNENLPNTGEFYYYDGWHDNYQKRVLGNDFDPNQPPLTDGLKVLDLVAFHPATARHLCTKLCKRFISDTPSEAVIRGAVAVWTKHGKSPTQIKETIRFILSSSELKNQKAVKIKRPFELIASLLRAMSADFIPTPNLNGMLSQMGYYHYQWPTPTGHPDTSEYWLSSNTMLVRWNTALNLITNANNKLATINFKALMPPEIKAPSEIASFWSEKLLRKKKSPEFIAILADQLANGKSKDTPLAEGDIGKRLPPMIALLTMSPDFQYR